MLGAATLQDQAGSLQRSRCQHPPYPGLVLGSKPRCRQLQGTARVVEFFDHRRHGTEAEAFFNGPSRIARDVSLGLLEIWICISEGEQWSFLITRLRFHQDEMSCVKELTAVGAWTRAGPEDLLHSWETALISAVCPSLPEAATRLKSGMRDLI
ncbi:hypothetical protein VTI74DRAFT_9229 [Chaetomium olivicolor]